MRRPVTYEELLDVEFATKGETTAPRRWPRELVEVWLAEDVINFADERRRQAVPHEALRTRLRNILPAVMSRNGYSK